MGALLRAKAPPVRESGEPPMKKPIKKPIHNQAEIEEAKAKTKAQIVDWVHSELASPPLG